MGRRWPWQWRKGDPWRAEVEEHFGYLLDLGFRFVEYSGIDAREHVLVYRNVASAVAVEHLGGVSRPFIYLARLTPEQGPSEASSWWPSEAIQWIPLDTIMELRPMTLEERAPHRSDHRDRAVRQLVQWSQTLRNVAPDFLAGDLRILDEAAEWRRTKESPDQVVDP